MGDYKSVKWKWFKRLIIPLILVIGISSSLFSQNTVNGTVTDQGGEALIGVNVLVKGTDKGTATDFDGKFELEDVNPDGILQFSYIGYQIQEIPVNDNNIFTIELIPNSEMLDEVIVVGYGTQKKSDLTGAVQRLDASKYETQPTTNFIEMLNGTVAGFNSNQGTSAAGGGGMEIRGQTSLKANNNPLIVLDGVIYNGSLSDINPSDIASIDILKDASSAAIYGARSASGVIIVTTKRGAEGKPQINFSTKFGVVGLTNVMEPLGPDEYLEARGNMFSLIYGDRPEYYYTNPNNLPSNLSVEEWKNFDATPSDDPIDMWLNRLTLTGTEKKNYNEGKTINWLDEVLQNGLRQDYDFSISGGSSKVRYFWSAGHTNNNGYLKGDQFKTVRSRINVDADVSSFLKISVNAQYADRNQGFQSASLGSAITGSPFGQIYDDQGRMEWFTHEEIVSSNPLIYYEYREVYNKVQSLFANTSATVQLPFNISYQASYTNRFSWNRNYLFDPIETPRGGPNNGYGERNNSSVYEWQIDNIIKWNKEFTENHKIDATFLFNLEKYQDWSDRLTNSQFAPSDALGYHSISAGVNPSLSSNDEYSTGNALMGRINYSMFNKYLLTLTYRRDGYSAFGGANPYATFPSIATAWRLSEEEFFNVNWLDYLKVRASWGINGNRDIGRYDAFAKLTTVQYIYGNNLATGVHSSSMANRGLRWERTEAYNFGLDFSAFDDHLYGSIDYYDMITNDLLLDRTLPDIIGYSSVASNLGELQNKGIEIILNSRVLNIPNKLSWETGVVFSANRNKITELYGDLVDVLDENGNVIGQREADDISNSWFIGQSIDRIWEYNILGLWKLEESDEALVYGRRPGDFKLQDTNEDGVLQPLDDKVFQGYKKPQYRLGFRNDLRIFNDFNLSFFVRADLDFYRINSIDENSSWIDRRNIYKVPYWTPNNTATEYARLDTEKNAPFKVWKNSSFVRLQDVSLSYSLTNHLEGTVINDMKVFVNFRNFVTLTKWDHWDPESGESPMPKIFSMGLNLNL